MKYDEKKKQTKNLYGSRNLIDFFTSLNTVNQYNIA